jgi:hypothetical protein
VIHFIITERKYNKEVGRPSPPSTHFESLPRAPMGPQWHSRPNSPLHMIRLEAKRQQEFGLGLGLH